MSFRSTVRIQRLTALVLIVSLLVPWFAAKPAAAAAPGSIVQIAGGLQHSLALRSDGEVWSWGDNTWGQLGDGTTTNRGSAARVSGLTGVASIAAGLGHSVALKTDGTVWSWGDNLKGQLGVGNNDNSLVPEQTTLWGGRFVAIAAGEQHSIAIREDGTVFTWGDNSVGQLGDGTTTNRSIAVIVPNIGSVKAAFGGQSHTLVLKTDGTVWAWGNNTSGELGDGSRTNRYSPVQVSGLTHIVAIAGGAHFSLALQDDGTVWAWGDNSYSQLGDGTADTRITPIRVPSMTHVASIASGQIHSMALKQDGTVWTWGDNRVGQIGDGTVTSRNTPTQVSALSNVTRIYSGIGHLFALQADGSLWAWGYNVSGQVGDGTTIDQLRPVPINVLDTIAQQNADLSGIALSVGSLQPGFAADVDHYTVNVSASDAVLSITATAANPAAQISINGLAWMSGQENGNVSLDIGSTHVEIVVKAPNGIATKSYFLNVIRPSVQAAELTADRTAYARGDLVTVSVKLNGFDGGNKFNSADFRLLYDTAAFELATGDLGQDIVDGIPAHVKSEPTSGTLAYLIADPNQDYSIVNGATVFSVRFKVKSDAPLGAKSFTLRGPNADSTINLLDSEFSLYRLPSVQLTGSVIDGAIIDSFVSLYLGDEGSELNTLLLGKLDPNAIDRAFENLTITVKSPGARDGVTYKGRPYWIPDANGHLAAIDGNNRLTGHLRITAVGPSNQAVVEIGGFGHLVYETTGIDLTAGQNSDLAAAANAPIVLLPGDVGQFTPAGDGLAIGADGVMDNLDFSAWLKIFKAMPGANVTDNDEAFGDFTLDGHVNNEDFSLWTAAYAKH